MEVRHAGAEAKFDLNGSAEVESDHVVRAEIVYDLAPGGGQPVLMFALGIEANQSLDWMVVSRSVGTWGTPVLWQSSNQSPRDMGQNREVSGESGMGSCGDGGGRGILIIDVCLSIRLSGARCSMTSVNYGSKLSQKLCRCPAN